MRIDLFTVINFNQYPPACQTILYVVYHTIFTENGCLEKYVKCYKLSHLNYGHVRIF